MDTYLTFFAAALILSLSPGPDNIFVLIQSALFGPKAGVCTTFGLATGLIFHTLAVTVGLAALMQAYPPIFMAIKVIGACYLLYLAWLSFHSGATEANIEKYKFPGYFALYRRGVIMNITNPKVALFFLALLPRFVQPDMGNVALQFITLGLLFILSTLLVFNAVALLGGKAAGLFNKSVRAQLYMNRIAACVFVLLALMILF